MKYRSNGKLLLTGEYTVLDGGLAFALPTKFGQQMEVCPLETSNSCIFWEAYTSENSLWFECELNYSTFEVIQTSNQELSDRLLSIFKAINSLNPNFLKNTTKDFQIKTFLEFPANWGLGSSSTLISTIAQWAETDAYVLLEKTFGGSGYDLACAVHDTPIFYQIQKNKKWIHPVDFQPEFLHQLYFLHLNQKQNSREGIKKYKTLPKNLPLIHEISSLSEAIVQAKTISEFTRLLLLHENLLSDFLKIPRIQNVLFNDFEGTIKSLGAWGGDFVLVASQENPKEYFQNKGYSTLLNFHQMIK